MASDGTPDTDSTAPSAEDAPRETLDSRYPERPRLACRTVRQADGPDRWTVYPPEVTGVPRMSTWLSVDASCVVDLETVR